MIWDLFAEVFSWVCGQRQDHTWMPGGVELPFCQRCTGLYIGALCCFALLVAFRIRPGARLLEIYGACLLLMVPFGFHLVPQGAVLRTLSGWIFSCGLVGYLWLLPGARWGERTPLSAGRLLAWGGSVGAGGAALLVAMKHGGRWAGWAAGVLGLGGLLLLVVLAAMNLMRLAEPLLLGRRAGKPVRE